LTLNLIYEFNVIKSFTHYNSVEVKSYFYKLSYIKFSNWISVNFVKKFIRYKYKQNKVQR